MIEVGRLAVKTAGRDAGKQAVVVDILDNNYVMIDGATRRRKCNINHLLLLDKKLDIKKNADHKDIEKEFNNLKLDVFNTKPKQKTERPRKKRKTSEELKTQKEDKKKIRDVFKKKKEETQKKAEETLEQKAGIDSKKDTKEKPATKETKKQSDSKNK